MARGFRVRRGGGEGAAGAAGRGGGSREAGRAQDVLGPEASEEERERFITERNRLAEEDREKLAERVRIEEEARPENVRSARIAADQAATPPRGERVPGKFSFETVSGVPDAQGESEVNVKLHSSVETPIDLTLYVPELSGLSVRREKEEEKKKALTAPKMDKDGILRIPTGVVGRKDDAPVSAAKQLLKIFEVAIAAKSPEGVDVSAAEKKLNEAKAGLYEESSALKRRSKYKTLELAVVAAREKKDTAVQKRMIEVVGRIKEAEAVDLFAPFGGEEGWKKHFEAEQAAARVAEGYLFAPKEKKKEEHGHGDHDDHHAAPKPDGLFKTLDNDLTIRDKAINAHFAKEKEKIKHDLETNKIGPKKAKLMQALLETKRLVLKYPVGLAKAMSYIGGVAAVPAIGVGLSLWDLTGLPGLKIARTELANWANWVLETLYLPWEIPTGEKKGKGGGGGHGGGH